MKERKLNTGNIDSVRENNREILTRKERVIQSEKLDKDKDIVANG